MARTERFGAEFRSELARILPKPDNTAKTAAIVGENFRAAEQDYFDKLSDPNIKQGDLMKAEAQYQKAVRVFTAFQQVMKNSFQIMMESIRNMSVR